MKWIRTQDIWQLICNNINGRYSSPNINIRHAYGLGYLAIKNLKYQIVRGNFHNLELFVIQVLEDVKLEYLIGVASLLITTVKKGSIFYADIWIAETLITVLKNKLNFCSHQIATLHIL